MCATKVDYTWLQNKSCSSNITVLTGLKSPDMRRFCKCLCVAVILQVKFMCLTLWTTCGTPPVAAQKTVDWRSFATCLTQSTKTSPLTWTRITPSWGSGLMTAATTGIEKQTLFQSNNTRSPWSLPFVSFPCLITSHQMPEGLLSHSAAYSDVRAACALAE